MKALTTSNGPVGTPQAFTLIELLVVVAIIAILATLLMPVAQQAVSKGMSAHCASNMHQIYLATFEWMTDSNNPEPFGNYNRSGDYPMWGVRGIRPIDVLVRGGVYDPSAPGSSARRGTVDRKWLEDASAFFCPQHGLTYAENYADQKVEDLNLVQGTYAWIFRPRIYDYDPTYTGNLERMPGYNDALMHDTGVMLYRRGIGAMRGEHYNLLHYRGNVEVSFAKDANEVGKKLGCENEWPYIEYNF